MLQPAGKKSGCHIVRERNELEQAFSLVHREYASRGYSHNYYKSKGRVSLFNALPATAVFIAEQCNRVVATVTLIPDSPMGLPMDKIYKEKLDVFRKKGLRIAEVSQLAIDSELFPKKWFSMFNFSKLMFVFGIFKFVFDYARNIAELDELCIAITPEHRHLYKFLFFEAIEGAKYCGPSDKCPVLAFHLSLTPELKEKSARERKGVYKIFYAKNVDSTLFKNKFVMKPPDLQYLFAKKRGLFKKATKKEVKYIQSCYPDIELKPFLKNRSNL
jgi:hypothetical protein